MMPPQESHASPDRRSLLDRLLAPFAVLRAGEGTDAILLMLSVFLLLMAYYLLKVVREPLILAGGGAEMKSYTSAAQAILLLFLIPLYGAVASRVSRIRLVSAVTMFFIANLLIFYFLALADTPGLGIAFFVWVGIFNLMIVAQFWSFANDVYTPEQGRRLFAILGFGQTIGATLGGVAAKALIGPLGVYQLLPVAAGLLAAYVALMVVIHRRARRTVALRGKTPAEAEAPLERKGGFGLIARDRYLLLIAFLLLVLNFVNTNGEYILGRVVAGEAARVASTAAETARSAAAVERQFIGSFYADYFTWVNALTALIQILLVSRIMTRFGVRVALYVLPVVALGAYGIIAFVPVLALIRLAKISENSLDYSLNNTARQALLLPTSREAKYNAKAAMDTLFVRAGDLMSAGLVFAGSVLALGTRDFAFINMVLIVIWLVLVIRIGRRHRAMVTSVLAILVASFALPATAQSDSTAAMTQLRTAVPGEHYRAGSAHRFLFGADYRHLWATPIVVPELDLGTYAGGLTPVRRVGGQQTLGLAMKGADGRDYTFRSLDKDPTDILPPELHDTVVDRLLQDQIASSFPGGAVAVPPLLEAVGVLHTEPILVVMPNDPRLGEFRKAFADVLGTFEEYPQPEGRGNPGFAGATEIINGREMWERMAENPSTRPDARAFLTARLVDNLIGDWDRHRGQWRWAKIPGKERWQPIPEDRDQAFVRFEGLVPALGRPLLPQFVSFSPRYPGIEGLTWNGRDGDRRILAELEKPVWEAAAHEVQSRITDDVIAEAVSRLPGAQSRLEGERLASTLRARRDALPEMADRFYHFLARDVDVYATDENEIAVVSRLPDGRVDVAVSLRTSATPYYRRTFYPDETDEVRIYLGAGEDSVVARGMPNRIVVRVIGGGGDDVFDDTAGARLRISDAEGANRVRPGPGTKFDPRPYTPPQRHADWIPPRDWGRRTLFLPFIGGSSDHGVRFVAGLQSRGYGFRKDPYADKQTIKVEYATRAGGFGTDYAGDFCLENSGVWRRLHVLVSGIDFLHYYGFGNETPSLNDEDFYKVKHTEYVIEPSVMMPAGPVTFDLHATLKYAETEVDPGRFIASAPPYGAEDFVQFGTGAGVRLDLTDSESFPTSGVRVELGGRVYPSLGSVNKTFGTVNGRTELYATLGLPLAPTLGVLAGGKKVWGPFPFHEAAYIGGSGTLRGFPRQRYAGDWSLYGSAELRLTLTRIYLFVPGAMGVFALTDVGRVFLEGETSDRWHTAAGGGLWFSFLSPENAVKVSVASSVEGTRVYVASGLSF